MDTTTREMILGRLSKLPALAPHIQDILQAINEDDIGFEQIAWKVSYEPTIVIRLLCVANSPFYGVQGKISSVQRAIQVVGLTNVKKIINALAIIGRVPIPDDIARILENFWQQSITVAALSDEIACRIKSDKRNNQAFTAGVLHDLGQVMLAAWYPEKYGVILKDAMENKGELIDLEKEHFGFDHSEVCAVLADHWNFPDELCVALHQHHSPENCDSELTWILHAADILHTSILENKLTHVDCAQSLETACFHLHLPVADWADILEKGRNKASAFSLAL